MFDTLNQQKKLELAKQLFVEAITADSKWQREAREDFLFRDGEQWSREEKRILTDEMRPCLTFNLTKSSIDLIMGMNEDNRIKHRCSPVDPTDGFLSEVLNDLTEWVQESNSFEEEEDSALESSVTCGRGYVAVDFSPDPKRFGEIIMTEVAVPVHEVHFDPAARRKDLGDASYIFWDKWLSTADFKVRYPKVTDKNVRELVEVSKGTGGGWLPQKPHQENSVFFEERMQSAHDTSDYTRPMEWEFYDNTKNMIRVVHMEYWEPYKRYFGFNPKTGSWDEFDGSDLKAIKTAFETEFGEGTFAYEILMDKKVKWLQFIGDKILFDNDSPLPFVGFSIVPLFTFSDISKRTANHFGVVRLVKDPQREINKRWSQALNLLNQQVQPGVYAETDAFVDVNQAERSMKEAGSITWLNSGTINAGKFKERQLPKFPDAPMQMEQFSQDIMKKITGINPDLLGQDRGRQEPGVVIRLRQQQGITLLKPIFSSFNLLKKELFKRQLAIIMAYMPDAQVLRILGSNDRYQIDPNTGIIIDQMTGSQANLRDVRNLEYNIVAEEAPGNMTKRMAELAALLEMQGQGFPVPPEQIIEKMSISESEKVRWLKYISDQQQAQSQAQDHAMQMEMSVKDRELKNAEQKTMYDFLADMAKIKQMTQKDELRIKEGAYNRKQQAELQEQTAQAENKKIMLELAKLYEELKASSEQNDQTLEFEEDQGEIKLDQMRREAELKEQTERRQAAIKEDTMKRQAAVKEKIMQRAAEIKEEQMKKQAALAERKAKQNERVKPSQQKV